MITDEMLTIAAKELAEAIDGSLIDAKEYDHAFSSKFENEMEVLIKKVNKKKKYKTLKHIACFMLVAIIGLGALFTFKTSAREYLLNWIKQRQDIFYEYFFTGNRVHSESSKYEPGWLPEGCELVTTYESDGGETYIYTNSEEYLIQFTYISNPDNESLFIDGGDYLQEKLEMNGLSADLYFSKKENETNSIIWKDTTGTVLFAVSGPFDKKTLIKIANNIMEQ